MVIFSVAMISERVVMKFMYAWVSYSQNAELVGNQISARLAPIVLIYIDLHSQPWDFFWFLLSIRETFMRSNRIRDFLVLRNFGRFSNLTLM